MSEYPGDARWAAEETRRRIEAQAAQRLNVLVIGNFSVAPCGIRNFADMTVAGLDHHPDLQVDAWDATYDGIYARREAGRPTYLPENWHLYDVIHLNWHPIALNTYGVDHFPWPKGTGPLVSVYLNDIPPWTGCPFIDRAEAVIAAEPTPVATHVMVYPIPDWLPRTHPPTPEFRVGCSGVRGDGFAQLRGACAHRGWTLDERVATAGDWTTPEEEIARMTRNTVNVGWYQEGRGISGMPSMALGSGRPLLLNGSPMFAPWWDNPQFSAEIYLWGGHGVDDLEAALTAIEADWRARTLKIPGPCVYSTYGWRPSADRLVTHWRSLLESR